MKVQVVRVDEYISTQILVYRKQLVSEPHLTQKELEVVEKYYRKFFVGTEIIRSPNDSITRNKDSRS